MAMLPQIALWELKFMSNLVQNYSVWIQYECDKLMVKATPYLILLFS